MRAKEIMERIYADTVPHDYSKTCDTCKSGDPEKEVSRIAVAMFGTVEVIRAASAWGAQLLIVHEPLYYNHHDEHGKDAVEMEKRALLESTEMSVWRHHDHAHYRPKDLIFAGESDALDLDGRWETTAQMGLNRIYLTHPITPRELAERMEERMGLAHIRLCGAVDAPCTSLSCMFGTPGGVMEELQKDECEIVLTGEVCEWQIGEYVRDAAQLGRKKALLVLGHEGSEREGMRLLANNLSRQYPTLDVRYFECGEIYTYTDTL